MKDLYQLARALYAQAFPYDADEEPLVQRLFATGFPQHFVALGEGGDLASMLFAFPYPIMTENGPIEAHYLYAVATAEQHRGKGYAKKLLQRVATRGTPVFLRPMSDSLFDFYKSAGFQPFSPHREWDGTAEAGDLSGFTHLTPEEYLLARDGFLKPPYCRMTPEFLSLSFSIGGAVGLAGRLAALYERDGETILYKEVWGDPDLLPLATKFLGGFFFTARMPDENGKPFGVGIGIPEGTAFLAALD